MSNIGKSLKQFCIRENGNVAIMFAMSLFPMVGSAGIAIDYSKASNASSVLQNEVDAAALSGARAAAKVIVNKVPGDKVALSGPAVDVAKTMIESRYTNGSIHSINLTGQWLNNSDFEVNVTAKVKKGMSLLIQPGSPNMDVTVKAVVRVTEKKDLVAFKPVVANLDFEAGDYNRMYVYCFDKSRMNDPDKGRRAETMTAISDNGGTVYNYTMPLCDSSKETISYRLYNVRGARTTPSKWDAGSAQRFNHYSDTVLSEAPNPGVASYSFARGSYTNTSGVTSDFALGPQDSIIETKLCDTLAQCKPISKGGILPEGKNRIPNKETRACSDGKFMYYGMEDRPYYKNGPPPGIDGWTDRDYDDIRIVVECPRTPPEPTAVLKLIR